MNPEPRWETKYRRGEKAEKLVDYILLAEFDIDSGSTLRHQYPSEIPDYKPDWFAEHMLPEGAHNRETDYTYIFLNRDGELTDTGFWIKPKTSQVGSNEVNIATKPFLYGLNFVKTKHDSTVRRGAILKALCIFSRYSFIESFKIPLESALEEYFKTPSIEVLKNLYVALNSVNISSLPHPTYIEQLLMRRGIAYDFLREPHRDHIPRSWSKSVSGRYNDQALDLKIPVYRTTDEVGNIDVTYLVKVFGEAVMRIYHAVLTKKKVLFVGYNHSASDIAKMVLSSVAMVCPPMTNVIRRTFPYSTLSDLSFLEVPGYVAGVTNPMFQQHESWWDLLCVLDLPNNSGFIYSAEERRNEDGKSSNASSNASSAFSLPPSSTKLNLSAAEEMPHYVSDAKFIQTVLSGINARINEEWVRQQFFDYTVSIVQSAQEKNMLLNPAKLQEKTRKFLESNSQRIGELEKISEFQSLPAHNWIWAADDTKSSSTINALPPSKSEGVVEVENPSLSRDRKTSSSPLPITATNEQQVDGLLLKTYVRKLLNETGLNNKSEVKEYYKHFLKQLTTEASLQVLLTMLPDSQGGLVYFAAGLLHSSPTVRYATTIILQRIKSFPSTQAAFETLNLFLLNAYNRQLQKIESGELQKEMKREDEQGSQPTPDEALSPALPSTSTSSNFEDLTAVLTSATGISTSDITQVVDEASTVVSSFFQHTLEFVNQAATTSDDRQQHEDENTNSSDHSDNISPLDLIH